MSWLNRIGLLALGAAAVLWLLLEWSSSVEQARWPGEKDLGVAVLFMALGVPALVLTVAGVAFLTGGISVWLYRSFSGRKRIPG